MAIIKNKWERAPGLVMERISKTIDNHKWFRSKLEFNLSAAERAFYYRFSEFRASLLPTGNPHIIKGEHDLYLLFMGPFPIRLILNRVGLTDCRTECIIRAEVRIEDRDLELVRFLCESRQQLDLSGLADELLPLIRTDVCEILAPYSYKELVEKQVREERAVAEVLRNAFARRGLILFGSVTMEYSNKLKEQEEELRRREDERRINRQMRERLSADTLARVKDEQQLKDEIMKIMTAAKKRELLKAGEIDKLKQEMLESQARRELARKIILEKEELHHRLELEKIELEFQQTHKEQERQAELEHLKRKHRLEDASINKKYDLYAKLGKTIDALDSRKIADLEQQLSRIACEMNTLPSDLAEGLKHTFSEAGRQFDAALTELISNKLSDKLWSFKKTILEGQSAPRPFQVQLYTFDKQNRPVTSREVKPGEIFECFIQTSLPGYLMLVDIPSNDGIPRLLVPNGEVTDNYLKANRPYSIYHFLPVGKEPQAKFLFTEDTEPGIERVVAIVTPVKKDPAEFFPGVQVVRNLSEGGTAIQVADLTAGLKDAREIAMSGGKNQPDPSGLSSEAWLEFLIQ